MKTIITKLGVLAAGCLAIAATASTAYAQNFMRVEIPFTFLAGEQRMPAGEYWVRLEEGSHSLCLLNEDTSRRAWLKVLDGARAGSEANTSRGLVSFQQYGREHVLRSVYFAGAEAMHELIPSKAQIKLERAASLKAAGEAGPATN